MESTTSQALWILTEDTYETAHGGYDPVYANEDADRVLPVDVLRDMEKEGIIGELHHLFYTTTVNGDSPLHLQKHSQMNSPRS